MSVRPLYTPSRRRPEPEKPLCRGCGRTLKEIAGWGAMSDGERDAVLRALPERIESLGDKASDREEALAKIREALGD
ncbi:MAG: DUF1289 domain-containing protein [Alphaproteobacteria bacterium HGW-Alphaproteobacteria-3]|nr:MAG: DUF1289 domain-containing protein [Alphaproteobacteria bacterium HGW-Alphaproteobacteria-3]